MSKHKKNFGIAATMVTSAIAATATTLTINPQPASAVCLTPNCTTVTVNGQNWDISTVQGNFNSLSSQLTATPWWNNAALTQQFVAAVNTSLGNGVNLFTQGPYFAYEFVSAALGRAYNFDTSGNVSLNSFDPGSTYIYAVASPSGTPIPTPALVPGLVALSISLLRKSNKSTEQLEGN